MSGVVGALGIGLSADRAVVGDKWACCDDAFPSREPLEPVAAGSSSPRYALMKARSVVLMIRVPWRCKDASSKLSNRWCHFTRRWQPLDRRISIGWTLCCRWGHRQWCHRQIRRSGLVNRSRPHFRMVVADVFGQLRRDGAEAGALSRGCRQQIGNGALCPFVESHLRLDVHSW